MAKQRKKAAHKAGIRPGKRTPTAADTETPVTTDARAVPWVRFKRYWLSRGGALRIIQIIGVAIVIVFTLTLGVFAYYSKDTPKLNSIYGRNLSGSVTYYDRTGKVVLWTDYSAVKRIPVRSDNISPYMKEATVAIEDKHFYNEGAFNVLSILRAAAHDVSHFGQGLEGASTITEQVVKLNEGWSDPVTLFEKVKEMAIGTELSRQYSKADILAAYLNIAPYGNVEYGVQSAAEDYFHTSAANLSLAQAAFLAAMPQTPTEFSPYSSPQFNAAVTTNSFDQDDLISRQHYVLDQMVAQHMITKAQATIAKRVNIMAEVQPLTSKYQNIQAPYFVLAAKQQLLEKFGPRLVSHGAWKVTTTLNMPLQQLADNAVRQNLPRVESEGADEEALVAEQSQTGQVVAFVGGVNFNNPQYGQVNYAQTNISPGSSIKPYEYADFINNPKNNAGAGSVLYDSQQSLPGYPCTNKALPESGGNCLWDYDRRYPGAETLRYALAGSRNVPAVKVGLMDGLNNVQKEVSTMSGYPDAYRCYKPGTNVQSATLRDETACGGSAAIGEGSYLYLDQSVNGLATLARLGKEVPQTYILNIQSASGTTDYQWRQPNGTQVLNSDTAYIMDNMLSDPRATYLTGSCTSYTCTSLANGGYKWQRYNGWDVAIKTGTSNANLNGLMTAWTTQYTVGTWVGYHTVDKPLGGAMEYMTEPLARDWMQGALDKLNEKPVNWSRPSNVKIEPAYVIRGHIGYGSEEPSPTTDIYPSWYTPKTSTSTTETIDKVSGLLATSCTPADAQETVHATSASIYSVDAFTAKRPTATSGMDNVHKCSDVLPSVTITPPPNCTVSSNAGKGCLVTLSVKQGTYPLSSGRFPGSAMVFANGQQIEHFTMGSTSPFTQSFYYKPASSGADTLTVTATDSVLYQSKQTATVTVSANTPGIAHGALSNPPSPFTAKPTNAIVGKTTPGIDSG